MKQITLLALLLCASQLLAAAMPNLKVKLTGQIVAQQSEEALEYATVSAFTLDSNLVDGTVSDASGTFRLNLESGAYLIRFEFLGFQTKYLDVDLSKSVDLGKVAMEADQLILDEVEIRAEKSQMNLMLDKKVFNIGQDALSRGGSANEVLDQLPSVNVSPEGEVSLRGNAGVNVLINGRPSALAANNALSSIPAENIEKVEIITNPSARYEASGSAGIINIILKKEQVKGYGGTASINVGSPADHRANFNLNWSGKNYNAFANLGSRYANFFGESDLTQRNFLEGVLDNLDQKIIQNRNDEAYSAYVGIDYNLNPTSTLTASYSLYDVVNDDDNSADYLYTDQTGAISEDWRQESHYLEPGTYHQIDLIYSKTYDTEGKKLTAYFRNDLWNEEETENIQINEVFPLTEELLSLRTNSIESSRDHLLQADYETPWGERGKLEAGIRGETRIITADYNAEEAVDGVFNTIPGFDNKLDYFERIGAAYFQYSYSKDAFGMQIGLRNEYTFVKVESAENAAGDIRKTYNRLFPSFSFNYKLSEEKSIQLSYSKRIRRPSFWQLNPFQNLNNPNALFIGNPDMDPSYTDRVELNFIRRWEKLTINPAIYASTTVDYFEVARDQQVDNLFGFETGTVINRPINLDRENQYGIEVTANYRPTEALNISGEVNYYGYQQRGDFGDRSFDFDFATWSSGLRIQWDLPKDISFQTRVSYRARHKTVQMLQRANYQGSASLSKQWNNRLTVSINTFSPNWWIVEVFRPSFQLEEDGRWTGWRSSINIQYRFEKGAKSDQRRGRGSIR